MRYAHDMCMQMRLDTHRMWLMDGDMSVHQMDADYDMDGDMYTHAWVRVCIKC